MLFLASFLVLLNGFFVAFEFAIVKVRSARIRILAEKGDPNAIAAREIVSRLDAYLSAAQLGITLASLSLGWIGEAAFASILEPLLAGLGEWAVTASHAISLAIAFIIITVLHIVVGEMAPKSVALRYAEPTTLFAARPMRWFFRAFYPIIWTLNSLAIGLLRIFGLSVASETELAHSEEELRLMLSESAASRPPADRRRRLMEQALNFPDRKVREIMVPRADIAYLDLSKPLDDNLETIRSEGYTRFPLCRGQLDEVTGIVHVREVFARSSMLRDSADLEKLALDPLFTPEGASADQLLSQFQLSRLHMAIVVDEYGGTSGIATLEDVLEELTGEIQDEYDAELPAIESFGDNSVQISGNLPVIDLARHLGVEIKTDEAVTTGGLVLEELGRVARAGDIVRVGDLGFKVLETRSRRVVRVLAGPYDEVAADRRGR